MNVKMRNEEYEYLVEEQNQDYARQAVVYGRLHSTLQISILLGAIALPFIVITSIVPTFVPMSQWAPIVLSLIVAGAAGLDGYFRFGETSSRLRAICKMIAREQRLYRFGIEPYNGVDGDRQLEMFIKQVEAHMSELNVSAKQNDTQGRTATFGTRHMSELQAPAKQNDAQGRTPTFGTRHVGEGSAPSRQDGPQGYTPPFGALHTD